VTFKPTTLALVSLWLALALLPVRAQPKDNAVTIVSSNAANLDDVDRVIFSPNRSQLATLGGAEIRLWDLASGRLLRKLAHEAYLTTAEISADGKWLIAAFRDGRIKLWNLTSGAPPALLEANSRSRRDTDDPVKSLWITTDSAILATGSDAGVITLWDIEKREKRRSFKFDRTPPKDGGSRILALRLTADQKRVIAVSKTAVKVLDTGDGKEIAAFELPNKYPFGDRQEESVFSRDSIMSDDGLLVRYSAPGCDIEELKYLSLNDTKDFSTIDKPENCKRPADKDSFGELSLFVNPERSTILIARSGIAELREWDPKSRTVVRTIKWPGDPSAGPIGIDAGFKQAASRQADGIVVREIEGGTKVQELKSLEYPAETVTVAKDGRSIMLEQNASTKEQERKQITLWQVGALDPKSVDLVTDADATVTDFAPAAKVAIAVNSKGEIVLFSTETADELRRFSIEGVKQPAKIRISPDGKLAAMVGEGADGETTAVLIDTGTGAVKQRFSGRDQRNGVIASTGSDDESDFVTAVAFSPDGGKLALGRFNGSAEIWDIRTMKRVKSLPASRKDADQIWSLAFTTDGSKVVAGSRDSGAFLWDARTGRLLQTFLYEGLAGHVHVASVAVSHNGSTVIGGLAQHAISSGDTGPEHGIKVWNAATGKLRFTLRGPNGGIGGLTFSADDRWIVSASFDGTINYWSSETGRRALTFMMAKEGRWFAVTESGLFAASPGGDDFLNAVRVSKSLPASQFRKQLDRPDLVDALLKGDPERRFAAAVKELDLMKMWDTASP
jgi:WD40 repeat protein